MKVSEVTADTIKDHCGISGEDSNGLIEVYKAAAISEICGYTALSADELDNYEDITYALLALIGEMYTVREMTVDIDKINPMAAQILGSHRRNLL